MNFNFTTDTTPFENLGLNCINTFEIQNIGIPTNLEYGKVYYRTTNGSKELVAFKVFACAICTNESISHSHHTLKYLVQYAGDAHPIWEKGTFETNGWLVFTSKEHYLRYVSDNTNTIKEFKLDKKQLDKFLCRDMYMRMRDISFPKTFILTKSDKKPTRIDSMINYVLITEQGISVCISHNFVRWGTTYHGYGSYDECMNAWLNNFKITDFEETTFNLNIEVKVTKPVITTLKISEI
jgi:hypothetical protein